MRREAGLLLSSNLQGSRSLLLQLVLLLGKFSHIAVQKRRREGIRVQEQRRSNDARRHTHIQTHHAAHNCKATNMRMGRFRKSLMRSIGTRNRPKPTQDRVNNDILVFCDAVYDFCFARSTTCEQDHEEPSEEGEHGQNVDGERRAHGQGGGNTAVTADRCQNARNK